MPVPPKLVRRLVLAPLVVVVEVVLVLVSPLVLLVAALISPVFGGWRPLRAALIALAFVARHLWAILACFGLWVASGFGRTLGSAAMQRRHFAVMRWFVSGVYGTIEQLARVEVRVTESAAAGRVLSQSERPVLVLGRHAGEGDTLLVLHELLCKHARGPRIVMHEKLRLDPLIDVLGDRLPNRFVDPRGGDTEVEIAAMASDMEPSGAVVLFPEGANFTPERRQRGIDRLVEKGFHDQAEMARSMQHVNAPRPGGALAAIAAAPGADVVIVGHVGFPTGLREVWRHLPERQVIDIRLWHEPAENIPEDEQERIDWLFGWWARLDAWVEETSRQA